MRATNLCFLIDRNKILLAMKKRGFGEGKWNGVGGKVAEGETVEEAAVREIEEEICVKVNGADLENAGTLYFYFTDAPQSDQECTVFSVKKWSGEIKETEEMKPVWYDVRNIPFDAMWVDDIHWLPRVLGGEKIEAEFHFSNHGSVLEKWDIKERPIRAYADTF